jgi:hypothetical protein
MGYHLVEKEMKKSGMGFAAALSKMKKSACSANRTESACFVAQKSIDRHRLPGIEKLPAI